MKKYLLPLIFTSFLFSDINVTKSPTAVNSSFELNNTASSFDRDITYTHKPLLSCSPKLSAVYKVLSSSKLKVIPTKDLQASSTYHCSYADTVFNFQTETFRVLSADYFENEKIVRLSFNDKINKKTFKEGIKLSKIDKLSKTNLNYTLLQNTDKTFILKINEKIGTANIEFSINSQLESIYGIAYPQPYNKNFTTSKAPILLDPEKKSMSIDDAPIMVALENGNFALRIFVNDNLTDNIKDAIEIEGISSFKIDDYDYTNQEMRERYQLKNSYYYHDVTSKEFKANSSYKVTFKKGLTSYYREIKEALQYQVKTANRAKTVLFDDAKPYLSNKGELSFSSVNIDKATLVVERILDDNLRYFMNFTSANKEEIDSYTKEIFSKELILNQEKNKMLTQKFKLSDLSKDNLAVGIYKISIHYDELVGKKKKEYSSSKILFLSNLGIAVNIGKEQAFINVFSLDKAQAMDKVEVQVYGANNHLLGTATTNSEGIAIISNKEMLKSKVQGIIVKTDNDQNFLALSQSIDSPSIEDLSQKAERFKAHVYFQSSIVRPKAKINALITIKDRDFISASKLPVKVIFKEYYGKKVHEKVYHTDKYGLINFNYQLDANDRNANYKLEVYLGDALIGSKPLKVEAFMPPKIENSIKTNKEIYDLEELLKLNITSSYLFGAVASNLQGKVTLNARAIDYVNKAFKNYSFSNASLIKSNINSYIESSEEIVLDHNGKFKILIKKCLLF